MAVINGCERRTLFCAETLHLLMAGIWLGGLPPLLLCAIRLPAQEAAAVCRRFSPMGMVAVGIVAATALLQTMELVGEVGALVSTPYGRLALLKLALFGVAVGLAALNRFWVTEDLTGPDPVRARRLLCFSIGCETAEGLAIILVAGFLASLPPGMPDMGCDGDLSRVGRSRVRVKPAARKKTGRGLVCLP